MVRGLLAFVFALSIAVPVQGAVLKRIPCPLTGEHFWDWNTLADQEKALDHLIYQTVERAKLAVKAPVPGSPGTIKGRSEFTNCVLEYPITGDFPIDGLRRLVFDFQWYEDDGTGLKIFQQHGFRLEYEQANSGADRQLNFEGISVCRTPQACRRLGIPFRRISPD